MIDWNDKSWINYVVEQVWNNLPASSMKSRNNSEFIFRCPICGDSKKNRLKKRGYFYKSTGTFHCFNCDTTLTGYAFLKSICTDDVFDRIVQDYKVLNFNNIVRGGTVQETVQSTKFEILSPIPSYKYLLDLKWSIPSPLSEEARKYLDERKIPKDKRDMLRTMTDQIGREFILIQYVWDDNCIYHQLHNYKGYDIKGQGSIKYIFPKDENINLQPKPVFNISNVDVSFPYLFCTEGVYDSLFIQNGVALGGRSLTEYQHQMMKDCYPRHKIILAFDNDKAGIQSSLRHADKHPDIEFLNTYDLLHAANCKDLNDFVKATGRTDIFANKDILKKLIMSPFLLKMKLKLKVG